MFTPRGALGRLRAGSAEELGAQPAAAARDARGHGEDRVEVHREQLPLVVVEHDGAAGEDAEQVATGADDEVAGDDRVDLTAEEAEHRADVTADDEAAEPGDGERGSGGGDDDVLPDAAGAQLVAAGQPTATWTGAPWLGSRTPSNTAHSSAGSALRMAAVAPSTLARGRTAGRVARSHDSFGIAPTSVLASTDVRR